MHDCCGEDCHNPWPTSEIYKQKRQAAIEQAVRKCTAPSQRYLINRDGLSSWPGAVLQIRSEFRRIMDGR